MLKRHRPPSPKIDLMMVVSLAFFAAGILLIMVGGVVLVVLGVTGVMSGSSKNKWLRMAASDACEPLTPDDGSPAALPGAPDSHR